MAVLVSSSVRTGAYRGVHTRQLEATLAFLRAIGRNLNCSAHSMRRREGIASEGNKMAGNGRATSRWLCMRPMTCERTRGRTLHVSHSDTIEGHSPAL